MPKTTDFFVFQQSRSQGGSRCRICQHAEARQAVREVLEEAKKRKTIVTQAALGEWIVKTFSVNLRPESIGGHLNNHESELWGEVRG